MAKKKANVEITEDTSREDVNTMVKEFMQERAELELADKDKKDSAGKQETSKETDVGDVKESVNDDAAAGETDAGGEGSAKKKEESSDDRNWLTDEIRAELPRWVSDEDLSEFSSRDELDRALGLMDRAALKAGRDAGKKGDDDQGADDAGQRSQGRDKEGKFVKQQKVPAEQPSSFEIDLDLSEFDEDLGNKVKGALTGLRDHYEGRLKALDERFDAIEADRQSLAARAIEDQFDAIVDSLGHADLFGKSGEENEKQLAARQTLFDETHVYLTGLAALGREGRLDASSVSRVLRMAFADHISKQEQKNLTKRITKQSNMRMGVGAERPAEQEFAGPLKNHPDVRQAFKQYRDALGED